MCRYLRAFVEKRGYAAVTVGDGDGAVAQFQAGRPAAVILDLILPGGMDGLAVLAAMKKIDCDVSIVVVSAQGRTNTVVQAMKLGAADFVSKPFEDTELEGPLASRPRIPRDVLREPALLPHRRTPVRAARPAGPLPERTAARRRPAG